MLLGFETSDDAAAWRISDDALGVLTVDFLTPLVDDPYDFGYIAAANALSDVFAMGGQPTYALNVLALDCALGVDVARAVLQGGADATASADCLIVGGHSVDDPEPKYGLCVFGTVHPDELLTNAGAQAGDLLFLTKPLGTGLLSAAYKIGEITQAEFQCAVDSMKELNRAAALALGTAKAHAATDVSGFGLAGHLHEMLSASKVSACLHWETLPLFPRAWELSCAYCRPNRTFSIMDFAGDFVQQGSLDEEEFDNRMAVICDPQTSGGILAAVAPQKAQDFVAAFEEESGRKPALIGKLVEDTSCSIFFDDGL